TPTDPETELADSRAVVLDQTLSDRRRASALITPLSGNPGCMPSAANFFDTQIVAAAIQLATQSTDADVRGRVWAALRDVHDPALAQPLLQALTSDPDRSVRYQAAL